MPSRKSAHVSETPATQALRRAGVSFSEHPYDYVDHGGTAESARQLGVPEHEVVKTLVKMLLSSGLMYMDGSSLSLELLLVMVTHPTKSI